MTDVIPLEMDDLICPLAGQHIAVIVPSYDGRIPGNAAASLIELNMLIKANGGIMSFFCQPNMALVTVARNALLAQVMEIPSITGVLHLDADIQFKAMDALSLIAFADEKYDVMCGLYRVKTDKHFLYFFTRTVGLDEEIKLEGDVLPCARVPLGFCYVKRKVLDTLWENAADRPMSVGKLKTRAVFETPYKEEGFIGEDYDFCDKVTAAGYKIGALPKIRLGHVGLKVFEGSLWDALDEAKSGRLEIIEGDDEKVII